MKMATVFESSDPVSMIRRQRGMISVERRKLITSELSFCCDERRRCGVSDRGTRNETCQSRHDHQSTLLTLTNAPITPKEVNLKYSKGRVLLVVFKNGYKNSGMWAERIIDETGLGKLPALSLGLNVGMGQKTSICYPPFKNRLLVS